MSRSSRSLSCRSPELLHISLAACRSPTAVRAGFSVLPPSGAAELAGLIGPLEARLPDRHDGVAEPRPRTIGERPRSVDRPDHGDVVRPVTRLGVLGARRRCRIVDGAKLTRLTVGRPQPKGTTTMRAATWQGVRDVRIEEVPDPRIEADTDAIIKVTSSGLCGSISTSTKCCRLS